MAAPITHLVFAQRFLALKKSNFEAKLFYIGTSFPDIRYLRVIDREKTHTKHVELTQITAADSFVAGMLFHSYLDLERERRIEQGQIYTLLPPAKFLTQAMKLFEDELLYEQLVQREKLQEYFRSILHEEEEYPIQTAYIRRWHELLSAYIGTQPNDQSRSAFFQELGFTTKEADDINGLVSSFRQSPSIRAQVEKYLQFIRIE